MSLRTVLRLAAGPLALVNVTFFVADIGLAAEDLLIGLPVLRHLGIGRETLAEQMRYVLNGADYSTVYATHASSGGGQVSRLMFGSVYHVSDLDADSDGLLDASLPHVNYFNFREEQNTFPDKSLLEQINSDQRRRCRRRCRENGPKRGR